MNSLLDTLRAALSTYDPANTPKTQWALLECLVPTLQAIRTHQSQPPPPLQGPAGRSTKSKTVQAQLDLFTQWLDACKAYRHPGLALCPIPNMGVGVVTRDAIQKGQVLIKVPKEIIMTSDKALSHIDAVLAQHPIVRQMPSFILSLWLMKVDHACAFDKSTTAHAFWQPYLDVLPRDGFTLPIFFDLVALAELKGTVYLDHAVKLFVQLSRQYMLTYTLLASSTSTDRLPLSWCTLERYQWAFAITATRQNPDPFAPASTSPSSLALIPLFDMFNHTTHVDTIMSYGRGDVCCEMLASMDVQAGEQVYMFYGARDAYDFFSASGFLPTPAGPLVGCDVDPYGGFGPYDTLRLRLACLGDTAALKRDKCAFIAQQVGIHVGTELALPMDTFFTEAGDAPWPARSSAVTLSFVLHVLLLRDAAGFRAVVEAIGPPPIDAARLRAFMTTGAGAAARRRGVLSFLRVRFGLLARGVSMTQQADPARRACDPSSHEATHARHIDACLAARRLDQAKLAHMSAQVTQLLDALTDT